MVVHIELALDIEPGVNQESSISVYRYASRANQKSLESFQIHLSTDEESL